MFFGAVAWGILDALYYYRPETQLSLAGDSRRPATTGPLRLAPLVMDRAIGTGLFFRF